ncbi:MAG: hypothetical protein C4518_19730 [Desulfobacteraceae bacterium]|nr:MAG: hypothetical protein C4518_19730 [Desulfobacteraceae bacterium]
MVYARDNLKPPTEKYFPPETTATCFSVNQTVVLQATPNSGYKFSRWVITGANKYTGSANPYSIKMPTELLPTKVTAYFEGNTAPVLPIADAGPNQSVKEGVRVTLDGTKSSDADGTIVSYRWEQMDGEQVALSNATTSRPTFTTPFVKGGDTLVFQLTVTDDDGNTDTDSVNIIVQWTDTGSLTADAGSDQSVRAGDTVTLDGSDSEDSEGQRLTYRWVIARAHSSVDTSQIVLSNPSGEMTTFITPNARGWVEFQLTVTNADGDKSTDLVMISISNADGGTELVANAGPDQAVATGSTVQLSGSWDSPDSTPPTYQWNQKSGPPVTLSGSDPMAPGATRQLNPTFTAPAISGDQETVVLQFIVKDANGVTATDEVMVLVDSLNYIFKSKPPIAEAGPSQAVAPGDKVTLDASDSYDPDGKELISYQWSVTSGPDTIVLSDEFAAKPTFTTPSDSSGSATFKLVVTDDATKTDTATVTVAWTNAPPTANAGDPQVVSEGALVTLYGSGSDPDGEIVSYHWAQLSGTPVTLSNASDTEPMFSAPAVTDFATLTFELTVTDNGGQSDSDEVQITVNNVNGPPVADAGDDQMVTEKAEVSLNGSGSSDPDGDTLSYQWIQNSGPTVTLSDDSSAAPTFTAPSVISDVILTFTLIVEDDEGLTSRDTVTVTVYPSSVLPVADAGPDQEVDEGAKNIVTLDASGSSDADEGIKSYLWEQQDGIGVVLSNPSAIMPTFEAPKISEKTVVLKFKLTVENYNGLKNTDSVDITVNNKSSNDGGGCFISTVAD